MGTIDIVNSDKNTVEKEHHVHVSKEQNGANGVPNGAQTEIKAPTKRSSSGLFGRKPTKIQAETKVQKGIGPKSVSITPRRAVGEFVHLDAHCRPRALSPGVFDPREPVRVYADRLPRPCVFLL